MGYLSGNALKHCHRVALHWLRMLAAIALLIAGTAPAVASEAVPSDQWEYGLEVYLWGSSIGGTTAAGDDIDISFTDLAKNLDFGFMSAVGARKGKWSILGDIIYLDVEEKDNTTANLVGNPIETSVDVELTGWIINLAGAYTVVQSDKYMLDMLVGVRYLDLDTDLEFDIGNLKSAFSGSGDVWDGIIGVKGKTDLSDKWYLNYYLDVGTGDSDFTWQALAAFGYHLKKVDINFGYRYLAWEFEDDDPLGRAFNDLDFNGPFAGVIFSF